MVGKLRRLVFYDDVIVTEYDAKAFNYSNLLVKQKEGIFRDISTQHISNPEVVIVLCIFIQSQDESATRSSVPFCQGRGAEREKGTRPGRRVAKGGAV